MATIVDIDERDNEYYAILQVNPKFAHLNLPAFCSPAIYQLDASENDNHLSKWMGLHLAGLDENPAYGARIAILRGTCNGPGGVCIHQLKTAKQLVGIRATKEEMAEIKRGIGKVFKNPNKTRMEEGLMDKFWADDNVAARQLGVLGRTRDDAKFTNKELEELEEGEIGGLDTSEVAQEQADIDMSKRINPKNPHSVFDRLKGIRQGKRLQRLAQDPTSPPTPRIKDVNVNSNDGREIADAYDNLKHDPGNPVVKESYDNFIDETNKQFDDLLDSGLKVTPLKKGDNPYANSKQMHNDISKNNHLSYFPTKEGFGEGATPKDHPMLKGTKFQIGDEKLVANDVFRIVHDVNGHNKGEPSGFGPKGEQQAFLTHKQLYGPKATRALFTETAGQNNWVNFNKKSGASNRADPKNTIFSEQKAGIFPDSFINRKFHTK